MRICRKWRRQQALYAGFVSLVYIVFLIFGRNSIPYSVYVVDRIVAGLVFVESSGVACVRRWKKCPVPGRRSGENARGINTGAAAVPQHRYEDVEAG